ncbi:tyrosine-type recombinase/integrase [Denitromonas ohlonensis]|uniref:Tyrosine-type recombinase/integrase n=2 Tax=Denitromonas TaxID=139331 RepID=A0A557SD94_9RHOO|nr:site-specific integrase [Denitromonas ohlonensis]TVO63487.1 tyrosine-type recombinase/integrase [Denitromonas ohlonensis]TVO75364.1 tyrosine-type recombinase/integrase [Denitromonas ohlonensis]
MALSDLKLKSLKPREKAYKATDRDGMYVVVSPKGVLTFRYDYRLAGRRETLTLGRYEAFQASQPKREPKSIKYGDPLSLADARDLLARAKNCVSRGESPSRDKAGGKRGCRESFTFSAFAEIWLRDAGLADSTVAMRKSILDRDVLPRLGNRKLEEITPTQVLDLCERIKARGAPATAVHAREIIQQVFRHAMARGVSIDNPAEKIKASAIATFKPRERALTPVEIRTFFTVLDTVGTLPTLKLALRFILLTLCRKGELLQATWKEIDFEEGTWTVPGVRMKARRPHVVYLSQQALDLLVGLKTCAGSSPYLLPGRYETDQPMSAATLNRVITSVVVKAQNEGHELPHFCVHDLRRTGSTLLHEAGFNTDWIEKCLAHEQRGVRAVYNKAEYREPRREMLQDWANMLDDWIVGAKKFPREPG